MSKQWGHGYHTGKTEEQLSTDTHLQRIRILMDVLKEKMQEPDTLDKFIAWNWLKEMIDEKRIFHPENTA